MTDDMQSRLSPECKIIQQMNDKRFTDIVDDVRYLKKDISKTADAISGIKEAITRLTVIQEAQQESIEYERAILAETVKKQAENIQHQNEVLEKGMNSQSEILETLLAYRIEDSKNKTEISGKKIAAIATIVTAVIATIGTIIANVIG